METKLHNRLATITSVIALVASVASAVPQRPVLTGLLAVLGFLSLVAALHLVKPPSPATRRGGEHAFDHVAASAAAFAVFFLVLLFVAALLARFAGVRYLGSGPVFFAEHLTLVTGPALALLALGPLLASRGRFTLAEPATPGRRAVSVTASMIAGVAAFVIALDPGLPTQPWHVPYVLAIVSVLTWWDAVTFAGLPTPTHITTWLERGETAETRALVRALALLGNGASAALALGAAVATLMGFATSAAAFGLFALLMLLVSTHAAVALRKAGRIDLEQDLEGAKHEISVLRALAIVPLIVAAAAALLTLLSLVAVIAGVAGFEALLSIAAPFAWVLVALLGGGNLFRARIRSYETAAGGRRSAATVAISLLATSGFFSLLVGLEVMSGPIIETGIGFVFNWALVLSAAVFVLARGLYPIPGAELFSRKAAEKARLTPEDHKDRVQRSLLFVYVASGAFLVGVVGLLAATTLGGWSISLPTSPAGRNAAFFGLVAVGIVLMVGLLLVFAQSRRSKTVPQETVVFKRRHTRGEVLRLAVLGVSLTFATVLVLMGSLVLTSQFTSLGTVTLEPRHSTDFFVFAILLGIGPAGFLHNRERRRISAIDARLPEFLRDLAEGQRTGMTLTQAVITSAKGNYGALTPEIRKMAAQIEWGISFENALLSFAKRVETPLVQRTVSLVIEASNSGGNVIDVLTAASDDAREIQYIQLERKGGMQIYVMIIYIAFLVFIGVIGILNTKFMPEVAKAVAGASGVTVGSITFQEFDIQSFRTLFFHAAIVQGLGGGFVAGAMEEGKPVAGLKHAFTMTIIAYVAFRFLLGG